FAIGIIVAARERLFLRFELPGSIGHDEQPSPWVVGRGLRARRRPIRDDIPPPPKIAVRRWYALRIETAGVPRARHVAHCQSTAGRRLKLAPHSHQGARLAVVNLAAFQRGSDRRLVGPP